MENIGDIDTRSLEGYQILDATGAELGRLEEVCTEAATERPRWARVSLLDVPNSPLTFVPLAGASLTGGHVQIAYDRAVVMGASRAALSDLPGLYDLEGTPPDWP